MKKTCLYLVLLFLTIYCYSQSKEIDGIKELLSAKITDTTKVNLYLSLSKKYMQIDLDSFKYYSHKALKMSLLNANYKLPRIYSNIGLGHFYNSNIDSAHFYYNKALDLLDKNDDWKTRAAIYGNYSMSYLTTDDFNKKVSYNLKAIKLAKRDNSEVSRYYYNHAVMYGGQTGLSEQSKKYLKLAYEAGEAGNNTLIEAVSLRGLAYYALEEKKLDSAQFYLEKGLEICKKTNSPQICFEASVELGRLYDNLKKYDIANRILLQAKKYALMRNRKYDIMVSNSYLGINEANRKNYLKASQYFQEFEKIFKEESVPEIGVEAYRTWSEAETERGNFKKSIELLRKSISLKDSIYTKNNREILATSEAKYEAERKDKELAERQLQLEQQQSQLQKKNTQYGLMTGITIFLLVSSILTWFLYRQRQKRKNQEILTLKREHQVQTLESLIEGEEKERLRIAKELHDGVNGDLSAIKFKLTSLLEKNNEVINEAVAMIDKSCQQVRAISHNLIPPSLKSFSLVEALEDYCTTMNSIHKPEISFHHIGGQLKLSKKAEANIFRIIQELVNNSIKHTDATEIDVQISHRSPTLQLTVEDNGKGFDRNVVTGEGIGLKNIDSRVSYLNGKLDFTSGKDGTSYVIEINTDKLNDH